MKRLLQSIDGFFFARRSAWPFGLLRIAWAGTTLGFFLMQWNDITVYYSDAGFAPRDLLWQITRSDWYVSLLTLSGEPIIVWAFYGLLLLALVSCLLGVAPRISTIVSYVLLASFHERDPLLLGGGDTVLRNIGFILMLAPGIDALSLKRATAQWNVWKKTHTLLPPVTMPAWPYRLLLWQILCIYTSSLWWKLLGDMWIDGSAVSAALHHPIFLQWPYPLVNLLMPVATLLTYFTIVFEMLWVLLLVPRAMIPQQFRVLPLRRILLLLGLGFHGGIAIIMDVGSFSFAMLTGYLGLLNDTDRAWVKRFLDRYQRNPLILLFDGRCGICTRAAFRIALFDTFRHITIVNLRDPAVRKKYGRGLTEEQLEKTVHLLLPLGQKRSAVAREKAIRRGFRAFRAMAWHMPLLWPIVPFLYLPGVAWVGEKVYTLISSNRSQCTIEAC